MGIYRKKVKNSDGKTIEYWIIRFQHDGHIHRKMVGKVGQISKLEVWRMYDEMVDRMKMGRPDTVIDARKDIPTLEFFSKEYLKYGRDVLRKRSWKRDVLSLNHLNRYFGIFKLTAITLDNLMKYQSNRLKEGVRPATVNRELGCLKHLINIAKRRNRFIGDNPVSEVKFLEENNRIERILTFEEETRLLSASPPHLRPIIVTALNTALRKSEILHLKWGNVDLVNRTITINATNTKSKKTKRIPLNSTMKEMLETKKLITGNNEYVFLNSRGKPFKDYNSIKNVFMNACKRANITGFRFHDLRHTSATRMLENGANVVAVSRILGHSTLSITMRYVHPDKSLFEAVECLTGKNDKDRNPISPNPN